MVELVKERILSTFLDDETREVYDLFRERASFGDFMFLNWQLITNPDDTRTLAHVAEKELGMLMSPAGDMILPQYVTLGSIHTHQKHIELLQKEYQEGKYFKKMAMTIQSLSSAIQGFVALNEGLPGDQKVSLLHDLNFLGPRRITDPDGFQEEYTNRLSGVTMLGISKSDTEANSKKFTSSTPIGLNNISFFDPAALGTYLEVLYKREPMAYDRFINGLTNYASYIMDTAAEMKIGDIYLRTIVKDPLMTIIEEYFRAAYQQDNQKAKEKLTNLMADILSGDAYVYGEPSISD